MSFALEVKEEIINLDFTKEQKEQLLAGIIKYNGELVFINNSTCLKLTFISNRVTRKVISFLKELAEVEIQISVIKNQMLKKLTTFQLICIGKVEEFLERLAIYNFVNNDKIVKLLDKVENKHTLLRAYMAGVFIAVGSVNSPKTPNYHLELQVKDAESAEYFQLLAAKFGIEFKVINRKNKYLCYLKKAMQVSDCLILMSATQSALKFENVRIERDYNNNINRMMNIDVYNQHKSLKAGLQQTQIIELIKEKGLWDSLSDKAKVLAGFRIEGPELSYSELEELMVSAGIKITKSGVSNLFRIMSNLLK